MKIPDIYPAVSGLHTCTHAHSIQEHMHTHAHMHTCRQEYAQTNIGIYMHAHMYTGTYAHVDTQ